MAKILISTSFFAKDDKSILEDLKKKGYKIILNPYSRKLTKEEFLNLAEGAIGAIAGTETIDKKVLEKLPELKVISRCGTGLDNVDLKTAKKLNKKVFNTPDAPTIAVAELAVALILDILRKTSLMYRLISTGKWEKMTGNLLTNKKVGIIGFGRIGKKVAQLLSGFDCDILI